MTHLQAIQTIEFEAMSSEADLFEAFACLIKSGIIWQLQGNYGRTAMHLINDGLITKDGRITEKAYQLINE